MASLPGDDKVQLHSSIISDSIVIWTTADDLDSFTKVVVVIRAFISSAFIYGLPLRGAIDYGSLGSLSFTAPARWGLRPTPIILGQGLSSAYHWESQQHWAGCIVTPSAASHVGELCSAGQISFHDLYMKGLLISYPVAIGRASGPIERRHLLAVNWPSLVARVNSDSEFLRGQFARHGKSIHGDRVEDIVAETLKFFEHCKRVGNMTAS